MSNVNFESGLFPSTSSTTDPVTGLLIGDRAVAADFSAMEKSTFVGQGLSRVPSSSGFVLAKTGMTITIKACKGNKAGYFFRLLADKDLTFTSSASEQVFYIGVRLVLASYGWANFYDDDICAFGAFVTSTDLAFAKLTIPANAVTITDNDIEDLRDQTAYCGFYDQYLASLQAVLAEVQALYDAFYSGNGISANDIKAIWAGGAQTLTAGEKTQACANAGAEQLRLYFQNQNVSTSGWATYTASGTEETAVQAAGYTYRKSLALSGVLNSMFVRATLSINADTCGTTLWKNILPYAGGIYIYAKAAPTSAFDILTINAWKAVS